MAFQDRSGRRRVFVALTAEHEDVVAVVICVVVLGGVGMGMRVGTRIGMRMGLFTVWGNAWDTACIIADRAGVDEECTGCWPRPNISPRLGPQRTQVHVHARCSPLCGQQQRLQQQADDDQAHKRAQGLRQLGVVQRSQSLMRVVEQGSGVRQRAANRAQPQTIRETRCFGFSARCFWPRPGAH